MGLALNKMNMELILKTLDYTRVGILITDPSQHDNPIIYSSKGFTDMTGYTKEEVIGNNCRFLQGEETSNETIARIREAVTRKESIQCEVLNYKKNGDIFWNHLTIDSVYMEEEEAHFFIGVQHDITEQKEAEQKYLQSLQRIEELETPIIPLTDKVSVLPLVGEMNESRYHKMTTQLLQSLENTFAETLLIDVNGLTTYNEEIMQRFIELANVLSLMGTSMILCGIKPAMAQKSITFADRPTSKLRTASTIRAALDIASK